MLRQSCLALGLTIILLGIGCSSQPSATTTPTATAPAAAPGIREIKNTRTRGYTSFAFGPDSATFILGQDKDPRDLVHPGKFQIQVMSFGSDSVTSQWFDEQQLEVRGLSPDRKVMTVTYVTKAGFRNSATGKLLKETAVPEVREGFKLAAFGNGGGRVALAGMETAIRVFDTTTGEQLFGRDEPFPLALTFSPDGSKLFLLQQAPELGTLKLTHFDLKPANASDTILKTATIEKIGWQTRMAPGDCAIAPDGDTVAWLDGADYQVHIMAGGKQRLLADDHRAYRILGISSDGKTICTWGKVAAKSFKNEGGSQEVVRFSDLATGAVRYQLTLEHRPEIWAISPDFRRFALCGPEGSKADAQTLRIYELPE